MFYRNGELTMQNLIQELTSNRTVPPTSAALRAAERIKSLAERANQDTAARIAAEARLVEAHAELETRYAGQKLADAYISKLQEELDDLKSKLRAYEDKTADTDSEKHARNSSAIDSAYSDAVDPPPLLDEHG
jgi:cell division septum initiation protein DivIVA